MRITPLLLFLCIAALPLDLAAQGNDAPPPAITVNGTAQIEATPDAATVQLGIVRQANTAESAQEQANSVAQQILTNVAVAGIPRQHIQTSRLTLTPIYAPRRPDSDDAPRIVAYRASNIVTIDIDDLTQIGEAIDAGLGAGANQLEGVHFRLKDDLAAREQALKQAVAEAQRKATAIAETLGVDLAGVLEVSEGGVSIMPRQEYGGVMMSRAADIAPSTPVSPGQLEVHASVMLRYRIRER